MSMRTPLSVIAPHARQNDASASGTLTHVFSPQDPHWSRSSTLNHASMSSFEGSRRMFDTLGAVWLDANRSMVRSAPGPGPTSPNRGDPRAPTDGHTGSTSSTPYSGRSTNSPGALNRDHRIHPHAPVALDDDHVARLRLKG